MRARRAIICAAGMGTRLRPLTLTTPKSLIKVNGKPILERQIEALKSKGIDEIIVVTGYLHEKFDYLAEKYNVKLVHNDKFNVYNNIYSMYLVRQYLEDAYVLDADVYFNGDFLIQNPASSLYFCSSKENFKKEWVPVFDKDKNISSIEVRDGNNELIHTGVSYWAKEDGALIVRKLVEVIDSGQFQTLYWDNIMKDIVSSLHLKLQEIRSDDTFEIDTVEDLRALEKILSKSAAAVSTSPHSLFRKVDTVLENKSLDQKEQPKQPENDAQYVKVLHA